MAILPIKLVGLTGLAGSGKDTVANIMATHFGYRKLAFADPLYLEIAEAFQIEVIDLRRRDCKEKDVPYLSLSRCEDKNFVNCTLMMLCEKAQRDGSDFDYHKELSSWRSPRWTLRMWGTEYRRSENNDYWISKLSSQITSFHRSGEFRFAVTDVRFWDEAKKIRDFGGSIWMVDRKNSVGVKGDHQSEVKGDEFAPEHVIENNASIRQLQQNVIGKFLEFECGIANAKVYVEDAPTLSIGVVLP